MVEMVGVEAFEQLFGPVRGQFEPKFSKNSNAWRVAQGGCLRFDLAVHNDCSLCPQKGKDY